MVSREPPVSVYKPARVPARELEEIQITVDEFEAIRLADLDGLSQREASTAMNVSQPTFSRILASARKKIARGLVCGMALRIEGGRYVISRSSEGFICSSCGDFVGIVSQDDDRVCPNCGAQLNPAPTIDEREKR